MKYLILTISIIIGFALCGVKCRGSELSNVADSLQPGEWGEMQTTGWGQSLTTARYSLRSGYFGFNRYSFPGGYFAANRLSAVPGVHMAGFD